MSPEQLLAKALERREAWVELEGDGRAVKVRRPPEAQMYRFRGGAVRAEDFLACVVDWRRFKELHILPPGVGADSDVPFDSALWQALALDNLVWCAKVSEHLVQAITTHLAAAEDVAKN